MAGFFSKLFGKNSPEDDSRRKLEKIRNIVMNLESKGQSLNSDITNGRNEIKRKRCEYDQLLAEYESLTDDVDKEAVMAKLQECQASFDGIERRIAGWSRALTSNAERLQTAKQAYERLKSAIDQGCSMDELELLIDSVIKIGDEYDQKGDDITKKGRDLNGSTSSHANNTYRDKVAEKLAKRAQAAQQAQPVPQVGQAPNDDLVSRPPTTPAI